MEMIRALVSAGASKEAAARGGEPGDLGKKLQEIMGANDLITFAIFYEEFFFDPELFTPHLDPKAVINLSPSIAQFLCTYGEKPYCKP